MKDIVLIYCQATTCFTYGINGIIAIELGITVYFAHPYSSLEKGAIENVNGLIRQYISKKPVSREYPR